MSASAWLRLAGLLGLAAIGSLSAVALAPLLIRPATPPLGPRSVALDLACLFVPTPVDWEVHVVSYFIFGLLLVSAGRGIVRLGRQLWRTHQVVQGLLQFARPRDGALDTLLRSLGLAGRVDLVQTAVPLAFCHGLLRPRICLSTGMVAVLTAEELTALLWHERYHLERRDPLKVALGGAWTAAFFFLPLAGTLYQRYLVAKEVEADAYACRQQGSAAPLTDALCVLLDLYETQPRPAAPVLAAGADDALEVRVARLLGQPVALPLPLRPVLVSAGLLLGLVSLEWMLAQASVADALWHLQHAVPGGC